MKIYLKVEDNGISDQGLDNVVSFRNGRNVNANLKDASFRLELKANKYVYLFGDVFYYIKSDGNIKLIDKDSKNYLKKIFSEQTLKNVISHLEGQYIGLYVDTSKHLVRIFSDRYARIDCFYVYKDSDFYFATDLDYIFSELKPEYDQKMLAHLFSVYGWYTPKGFTIYENVKQLQVGEIITLSKSGMSSEIMEFKPLEIQEYADKELEAYYTILRESIIARANHNGATWVSTSSGWDSSIILGILVDEFGSRNVRTLAGSMNYSEGTEVINKFEINKIKKIGEYYGIKPVFVDLDFKSKTAVEYWKKSLPFYKARHIYTYVTFNFSKLSDGFADVAGKGQIVFNGEVSDSFHNFGFSQFTTFSILKSHSLSMPIK